VLGLGNPLMADDGAGIQVIELLWQETLPPNVIVQDGGTAGVGLIPEMEGYQKVILVDCASMGLRPGEWKRFTLDKAQLVGGEQSELSLHSSNLAGALRLAEALNVLPPELIIYGIEPARVEWDRPMSHQVVGVLPQVAQAIVDEVKYSADK